jgi:hypothetical protein
MEAAVNTKFIVLPVDNLLNVKNHNEQMIPKLSGAVLCHKVDGLYQ